MDKQRELIRTIIRNERLNGEEEKDFVSDYLDREREENAREAGLIDLEDLPTVTHHERSVIMANAKVKKVESKRVDKKMVYDGAVLEDAKHDATLGQQSLVSWKKLRNAKFSCEVRFELYKTSLKAFNAKTNQELFTILIGKDKESIFGITPVEALAYVAQETTVIG